MPPLTFAGTVDDQGVLRLVARTSFKAALLARKNRAVVLVLDEPTAHRTTPQMGYYWSTVLPAFAAHVGYRRDELDQLHEGLMHKFWPLPPDRLTGSPRRRRLSLKESGTEPPLSDQEMGQHIDHVIQFAAEQGCVIPDAR